MQVYLVLGKNDKDFYLIFDKYTKLTIFFKKTYVGILYT